MKPVVAAVAGVAGLFCIGSANANNANFVWSLGGTDFGAAGIKSSVSGATTITFDEVAYLPSVDTRDRLNLVLAPSGVQYVRGAVVNGNIGSAAPPAGDTSNYFTAGPTATQPGSFVATFYNSYFGFNYSSPDGRYDANGNPINVNTIEFFRDNVSVGLFTGKDLADKLGTATNGNQGLSYFMNVTVTDAADYFNKVSFSSTQNAFETYNHGYIAAVPEPGTFAMLLAGLGMMGFIARRRRSHLSSFM
jgi:hypothetical protein